MNVDGSQDSWRHRRAGTTQGSLCLRALAQRASDRLPHLSYLPQAFPSGGKGLFPPSGSVTGAPAAPGVCSTPCRGLLPRGPLADACGASHSPCLNKRTHSPVPRGPVRRSPRS